MLRATDKALAQGAGLIDAAEAERIGAAAEHLRSVKDAAEADAIGAATDRLNHETQHLAELLMDSTLREALRNRRVTEAIERT